MENKPIDIQSDNRNYSRPINCLENKVAESARTQDTIENQLPILSTLINTIPNPAFYKNAQGVFVDCNTAFAETILGTACENIVGQSVYDLSKIIPQALIDICSQHDEQLLNNPGLQTYETAVKCADGVKRDFLISRSTFSDHNGTVTAIISVMLDLTDKNRAEKLLQDRTAELLKSNEELNRQIKKRKKAKKTVKEAHREIEHLISSLPTILIGLTKENKIIHWNTVAEKVLNTSASDVMGLTLGQCRIEWDWDKISDGIAKSQTQSSTLRVDNIHYRNADGEERYLGLTITPLNGEDNSILGLTIIGADITDRIKFEAQLHQSQKMEAIGQLAAGIAHEINTPAQFVGDNTRFLQDAFNDLIEACNLYKELIKAAESKPLSEEFIQILEKRFGELDIDYLEEEVPLAIQQTLKGVDRITHIVQAMKIFAHPGGIEKEPTEINKEIEKTLIITRNEWKYVAELVTDFDKTLPTVPCHRAEFNQVILNLIVNAAHAIADANSENSSEKGTITISSILDGNWAEIRISDTGHGIPEEVQHRIFDLFFTTKEPGRGTGQGLAIAHSVIVEKHNGVINFETEKGKGTTFVIRLPIDVNLSENE
ncbi:MAG: PAS domain S-box protein [Desulfobacterales bacterium]|nr:PAS domain S-box protein [Desulfobacterales bacterium]